MQVIQSPSMVQKKGSYVAIGKWDGVHLGHQQLIHQIVTGARKNDGQSIIVSFDRHPLSVLKPGSEPYQLQSVAERSEWLAALDVDVHLVLPFTKEFANLSPENFVRDILMNLNTREVIIGYNFRFGKKRGGTPEVLSTLGAPYGINVKVAPPIHIENEKVSSTLIRSYLQQGEVEKASKLLGRPAVLNGHVHPQPLKKNRENDLYELFMEPSRKFLGPGVYIVKIENASSSLSSNALLIVKKANENSRYFLFIKKAVFISAIYPIRVYVLHRSNEIHGKENISRGILNQDSIVTSVVNS